MHDLLCSMASAVAAIIAVAGTLLGSALTYAFQRQAASRVLVHEFGRQLRGDRLAAYSDFMAALTEFRRAEIYLCRRESEDPEGPATAAADADSWRLRGVGLTSVARVRLLAGDRDVVDAASRAWAATGTVREGDPADVMGRAEAARAALDAFVELAAKEVQAPLTARREGGADA